MTGEPNHTPLMVASGNGHVRVVQLLLEAGAQKEAVAADGSTPLMWAALEGRDSVVRLLLEAGAEMDVRDQGGWTAPWKGDLKFFWPCMYVYIYMCIYIYV